MKRPAVLWATAAVGAVLLAVLGVLLYAGNPGVATYQLNGILLLPLLALTLYGLYRALPMRVQWIAAVLLAPLGGIAYLVWPNDQWWNYGPLTVLPLAALTVAREERLKKERGRDRRAVSVSSWNDGPWGPP
jgi:peptidoglycan/LPS O-acetylase OafA/YrhL